jgi:hypothetical protein
MPSRPRTASNRVEARDTDMTSSNVGGGLLAPTVTFSAGILAALVTEPPHYSRAVEALSPWRVARRRR